MSIEVRIIPILFVGSQSVSIEVRIIPILFVGSQCVSIEVRIINAFNKQMGPNLTWHDVIWMYECHQLADSGYYLKSRSFIVRLVLCLPKSNKSMNDDFLIVLWE